MHSLRMKWQSLPRGIVVAITALAIYVPLSLIIIQSFLSAPFFMPDKIFSLDAFHFIFDDPDFPKALKSGFILAAGLAVIAVPLGSILAFLMSRTDLPGRRWIEPLILVPVFVSPMVLGFGYVVATGPVGFFSLWAQDLLGFVPWNVYSLNQYRHHRRSDTRTVWLSLYGLSRCTAWARTSKRRPAWLAPGPSR